MEKHNELENLMYAIGMQLYKKDEILYDLFDKKFNHTYVNFSYCPSEEEKIKQLEIIRNLISNFSLLELINKAMLQSDYYRLHQLYWWISNYEEMIKKYKLNCEPTVKLEHIKSIFNERLNILKESGLGSWRKSNDKVLHHHYYWWINNLLSNEDYSMWVLQYNDTKVFDTFHLSNCGDKRLPRIILQYILDNHIISNQIEDKNEIKIISPFIDCGIYNNYKINTSSNMGGMWYLIYLTAKELQEIYKSIGSKKIRDMNVMPFFSYVNSLRKDYELETRFYLYFKK